jgi:hypothetical protein
VPGLLDNRVRGEMRVENGRNRDGSGCLGPVFVGRWRVPARLVHRSRADDVAQKQKRRMRFAPSPGTRFSCRGYQAPLQLPTKETSL